jgi:Co/Zn/Cd efflux system component
MLLTGFFASGSAGIIYNSLLGRYSWVHVVKITVQLRHCGKQRGTLIKVLWINAIMFIVIAVASFYGKSTALLSDSLDNLGDALIYGLSLYSVAQGSATKAKVALFKGGLIFGAASLVVAQILSRFVSPVLPSYEVMSIFSVAGLGANGACLLLLWRHRHEDINMSSVFECSRNDIAVICLLSVRRRECGTLTMDGQILLSRPSWQYFF